MTSRQDEVRIVQVDPDGNVVYQGASERETTVRLFDTSLRPLSSTAEKLLKIIAEDQILTPGPGFTAARPTWSTCRSRNICMSQKPEFHLKYTEKLMC